MRAKTDYFFRLMRGPGVLVLPLFIIFMHLLCPAPPHPLFLVLPHSPFVLAPLYCKLRQSSGRAGPGGLLGAGAREATGSSSGAAAAAAFFIAALDAFAARGKACGETCVEGGSPSTSVQSASVALSTCPGPALSTPRATWWKGSFPSGVVSARLPTWPSPRVPSRRRRSTTPSLTRSWRCRDLVWTCRLGVWERRGRGRGAGAAAGSRFSVLPLFRLLFW